MNLDEKKILVTGGSGSLGKHLLKELLVRGAKEIISVSRDEGLIKEAQDEIQSPDVKWVIGDVSDRDFIKRILENIDLVYHTAALKHVTLAENNPREVLKINILGILNILDYAQKVQRFINISSDKAIGVVNCYGASKLFGEYLVSETNNFSRGKFINIRCPNLFGSRGSVLDIWRRQIKKKNFIEVTDPKMTRFFITISDAAKFIIDISLKEDLNSSEIYYPLKFTKKFHLDDLAKAFIKVYGNKETKIKIVGAKSGEKIHEDYLSDVPFLTVNELISYLAS